MFCVPFLIQRDDQSAVDILTREACAAVLHRNDVGRLGCFSPEADESYIVPISYEYRDGNVYFACLPGQKLQYLRQHPRGVCFEVEEIDEADQWTTVVVSGTVAAPSGWELVRDGLPTIRRVARGPLRSHFSGTMSPDSLGDLVQCVLQTTKIDGRRGRWDRSPAPSRATVPRAQQQPMGFSG